MKKLFTMFGAALLMGASAIPANAAETTIWILDYDGYEIADSYTTTVTGNEDGSYTIADFLNSGQSVTFTFEEPEVGAWNDGITITSPTYLPDGYYYPFIRTSDGQSYVNGKVYDLENTEGWTTLETIYIANETYSGIYRYDISDPSITYEYYASICTSAYLEDGDYAPWLYVSFLFNKPENETSSDDFSVYLGDENSVWYQSFNTGFVQNEDGSYTMSDFVNSGYPISFTFDTPQNEGDVSAITFIGNINRSGKYVEFLQPDGDDMCCQIYESGSKKATNLWYPNAYEGSNYCYIEKQTEEEAEYYGGDYYGCITFYGTYSDGSYSDWFYAVFYFDLPLPEGSTAVNAIEEDNDAPVEYYNLNGVKVANPSNGIYIRKQGNNVKKVVIK